MDRVGLTALQASEAAATAGQTEIITSDSHQVVPVGSEKNMLLIRNRLNDRWWF